MKSSCKNPLASPAGVIRLDPRAVTVPAEPISEGHPSAGWVQIGSNEEDTDV
ncbi:MAG: hypothetical protein O3B42_08435 [Actinomycetota bacterium]|nr:hypothetical protein [Actinomycetota bacterium]